MINNVGLYQSILNTYSQVTTSKQSEVDVVKGDPRTNTGDTKEVQKTNDANLYLSSKSQKINALSSEFFNNKDLNFADIEKLKERAYQFGLISKSEYSALSKSEVSPDSGTLANTSVGISTNKTSVITIRRFIDDFLERLDDISNKPEKNNADNKNNTDSEEKIASKVKSTLLALSTSLKAAKNILTDVNTAKTKEGFKKDLSESLAFIKETINTEAFDKMPLDDKVGLSKVYQALEIVSVLTPQRLNNAKINKYIDLID